MKAKIGDWLVVKGRTNGQHEQRGLITDVRSRDGAPPYVVRWLQTGDDALVFPGPDAVVVTAAGQAAKDVEERERLTSLQSAIDRSRASAGSSANTHSDSDIA